MQTLTEVLKLQLDAEGKILNTAQADDKGLREAIAVTKEIRKELAGTITRLKAQLKAVDRKGGGRRASEINRMVAYFRESYNNFFEELLMYKAQLGQVKHFLKTQQPLVIALDKHWEDSKVEL